ncbi:MAG TPA: phospholipase D-like domain-containing protein [Stellaceae bacterium]|jgi:phosphatidylserine/phosphatidylglycerophosphate/cardiolipin synthase-like enzyme|nr:phospholipase D-like domain-containing protein [Stellaceae bacterium]
MATPINHAAINRVIRRNLLQFKKTGVMTVRPGYQISGGWITDKPAIVATVDRKLSGLPAAQRLPAEVDDVPVDVREATGMQRLRHTDPAAHALVVAHGRSEYNEPDWSYERRVSDGALVPKTAKKPLNRHDTTAPKSEITYEAPAGVPLVPVTRRMTITASASPDDGYPVLTDFLAGTRSRLTIAMYDFTSGDLLDAVSKAIKGKSFEMVLDHPPVNQTANQTDDETRDKLLAADPAGAKINWALTRNDPVVDEWIYPSAYHIKVAVRDGGSFWLSSGNFNVSNQPNLAANEPKRGSLAKADRDWHLVVEDEGLAQLFEAYIRNDFTVATPYQTAGDAAVHAKIRAAEAKLAAAQAKSTQIRNPPGQRDSTRFAHEVFANVPVTVQPLLTPDPGQHMPLYVEKVLALIDSAQRSVYMQTQYVHPSDKDVDKNFTALVEALANARKKGLDVRLITSQYENTPQWVEKMKEYDLDQVLHIQERVHNKGIVVDSKTVMVSSQNWSGDGTLRNRDAGLIIEHAGIAQYFEKIFIDDWTKRSGIKLTDRAYKAPARAGAAATTPKAAKQAPKKKAAKKTAKKVAKKKRA